MRLSAPVPSGTPARPLSWVLAAGLAGAVLGVAAAIVFGEWRWAVAGIVVMLLAVIIEAAWSRSP